MDEQTNPYPIDEPAEEVETLPAPPEPEPDPFAETLQADAADRSLHGVALSEWSRHCADCQQTHDFMHACPALPEDVLKRLAQHRAQLAAMCADPDVAKGRGLRLGELVLRRLWAGQYG